MPAQRKYYISVCAVVLLVSSGGCGRHAPNPAPPPRDDRLRINWASPGNGDVITDTVRIELAVDGGTPIGVAVTANETLVAQRDEPPWRLQWLPSATSAGRLRLLATAHGAEGLTSVTPEIEVDWHPNDPPLVRFLPPALACAIDRSSTDSLFAEAIDPEDGRLPGDALVWISSLQGFLGQGDRMPLSALLRGRHDLRVRAADRWLRNGWAERVLEVFEYQGGSTSAGTMTDLRYALIAHDPGIYAESLAPSFRFLFCLSDRLSDPEVPARWGYAEEAAFARSILQGSRCNLLDADWTVASLKPAVLDERTWMKAELCGIKVRIAVDGIDTLTVVNGSARVYLSRATDEDRWRVEQWHDLGSDAGLSQGRLRMVMRDSD